MSLARHLLILLPRDSEGQAPAGRSGHVGRFSPPKVTPLGGVLSGLDLLRAKSLRILRQ